jgi:hypothetical protein
VPYLKYYFILICYIEEESFSPLKRERREIFACTAGHENDVKDAPLEESIQVKAFKF